MKTERIRFFALLLAALLMLTLLPVAAFAVDGDDTLDPNFYLETYSVKSATGKSKNYYTYQLTLNFRINTLDENAIELANIKKSSLIPASSELKVVGKTESDSAAKVVYKLEGADNKDANQDQDIFLYDDDVNKPGEVLTIKLYLKADNALTAGSHPFPFSIRLNTQWEEYKILDFSSVNITVIGETSGGKDDDDESEEEDEPAPTLTPHLVITSVSTAGQQLPTDEDFTVTISFKNTGKSAALESVMMSLTPEAGITLPKASTNFYIEKIKAGETVSQTFTLYADSDTVKTTFASLGIAFSYQYLANDAYASGQDSENVSLFFGNEEEEEDKEDRFDILDMELPDYLYPGEENYLTFTIINKGSVPVYNVMGKIESEALSNNGASEYYGQLAANTKDELELPMVATAGGEVIGTATITYELEDGTEKTIVRDFTAYAEEVTTDDPGNWYPEEPIPDETTGPNLLWLYIGGGVVVAAILTTVLVKRAKKKKAAALADDDI